MKRKIVPLLLTAATAIALWEVLAYFSTWRYEPTTFYTGGGPRIDRMALDGRVVATSADFVEVRVPPGVHGLRIVLYGFEVSGALIVRDGEDYIRVIAGPPWVEPAAGKFFLAEVKQVANPASARRRQ